MDSKRHVLSRHDAEKINSSIMNLVFGYIRNASDHVGIPMDIALIVVSYYHWKECFTDAHSSYRIINSKDEKSVEQTEKSDLGSAFGNVLISSQGGGIYIWKFDVSEVYGSLDIGISTEYEDASKSFCRNSDGYHYCFEKLENYLCLTYHGDDVGSLEVIADDDDACIGIVKMTLDLNQKILRYECYECWGHDLVLLSEGVQFDDVICGSDVHYKMAVCCWTKGDKIKLLDFCAKL